MSHEGVQQLDWTNSMLVYPKGTLAPGQEPTPFAPLPASHLGKGAADVTAHVSRRVSSE